MQLNPIPNALHHPRVIYKDYREGTGEMPTVGQVSGPSVFALALVNSAVLIMHTIFVGGYLPILRVQ